MKKIIIIASLLISSYAYTYTSDKDWTNYDPCCEEKDGIIYDATTGEPYTGVVEVYQFERLREITPFKDGKRHGVYKFYDCHGSGQNPECQLADRINYKDGKYHGLYENFYAYYGNGQICQRSEFKDGEPNGIHEVFNEKGELVEKGIVTDDGEFIRANVPLAEFNEDIGC